MNKNDRQDILNNIIQDNDKIKLMINAYDFIITDLNDHDKKFFERYKDSEFYSKHLITFKASNFLKEIIQEVLMVVNLHIRKLKPNDELRKIYESREGASIMGAQLYSYTIPENKRKKKPEKETLYNIGYLNGEIGKECLFSDLSDVLMSYGLEVFYDCGWMD